MVKMLQIVLIVLTTFVVVKSCNESVCGSIVSKCLLIKSCSCDLKTRVCSKECYHCLGQFYSECCSCVGMCPTITESTNGLSAESHVENFFEAVPDLFNVLTEIPDELSRWIVTVYPIKTDATGIPTNEKNNQMKVPQMSNSHLNENISSINCTVVFWTHCMSWAKCKRSCLTMGSSSYRWFHDGCCECVGQHCVNYGINESRCHSCPETDDIDQVDENELDFGEDDDYDFYD